MKNKKIKILMVASEITPIAKVGGLGDVLGSLPQALKKVGCDVRLVIPLYGAIDKKKYDIKKTSIKLKIKSNKREEKVNVWQSNLPGSKIIIYFIENKKYFGENAIYTEKNNDERYLFLSLASLAIISKINFNPDVLHCHDFHTAVIPKLIKTSPDPKIQKIKTILTIHNLNHQGWMNKKLLAIANLDKKIVAPVKTYKNIINILAEGLVGADIINTVSPTYAKEILTKEHGAGLEDVLRKRKKDVYGILNGIDVNFFDPKNDKNIVKKYSSKTINNKTDNKVALQKKLGLPVDKNIPLIGIVTRLVWQKGINLINEDFANLNCQFVVLGTGEKKYEIQIKKLAKKYKTKFSAQIYFDANLAQEIYAASDAFLVPSRFEPCGLTQMIAMRYGSVPIVRLTGGLADTVNSKVGFIFKKFDSQSLYKTIKKAITVYKNNSIEWRMLQINGMNKDFSWNKSAKEYLKLYEKLVK